jgi:ribosomal protein S18 acetylase RimI-like enzyme
MTSIVDLAPQHAPDAARLHIAGQPGTFLTSLGPAVLTVLYQALPQSPVGFGFAALDSEPDSSRVHSPGAQENGSIVGFVSATTSVGRLFLEMGTRRLGQFLPPLCSRFVRNPSLALRSLQTILYPFVADDGHNHGSATQTGDARGAELLSIMVEPDRRGHGLGGRLMQALLEACLARDLAWLDVTVDADNNGARRFYTGHGFEQSGDFELYGRAMCLYHLPLVVSPKDAPDQAESPHEHS